MSSAIDQAVLDYAQYLASLPHQEARKRANNAVRARLVAVLPPEEVNKPPIRSLGEYLDEEIELPPMLVEPGFVARGALSTLTSRGGKGKTAVSLNRLIRWSMGRSLFEELPEVMAPIEPLRVLLIENEGAPGHFQQVLSTILHGNDFDTHEVRRARENITIWGNGGWSGLKLDDEENVRMIRRACEIAKPDILFLEPFRGLWKGSENDDVAMSEILDAISQIANDFSLGAMLTHHERKSSLEGADPMSAARGSTALEGHAAVMERWAPAKGVDQRELSTIKNRFNPNPPAPLRMEFEHERWGYRYVGEDEQLRTVVELLREYGRDDYVTVAAASEHLGETKQTARRWLNKAEAEGFAKKKALGQDGIGYRYAAQDDEAENSSLTIT